jgi:hypothetical protein
VADKPRNKLPERSLKKPYPTKGTNIRVWLSMQVIISILLLIFIAGPFGWIWFLVAFAVTGVLCALNIRRNNRKLMARPHHFVNPDEGTPGERRRRRPPGTGPRSRP